MPSAVFGTFLQLLVTVGPFWKYLWSIVLKKHRNIHTPRPVSATPSPASPRLDTGCSGGMSPATPSWRHLRGDQLSWAHSQTPRSLKTPSAAQNILPVSWWGTATKALPQGGRNTVWQWRVSYPTQHGAHPVPHASRPGSPAPTLTVPRGKAAPSPCPTRGLLRHWRVSTERPPCPGTCAWCRKTGAAGICSSLLNKLSPIIALALESKASGVMNNCYF